MIAAFVLLHPELTVGALLSTDASGSFDELVILRQLPVVNVIDFTLKLGLALLFLYFGLRTDRVVVCILYLHRPYHLIVRVFLYLLHFLLIDDRVNFFEGLLLNLPVLLI